MASSSPTRYFFVKPGKDRFTKWLSKTLEQCKDAILALGLIFTELGSHSFRKGIATSLANNPGGPAAINIWLRAGWSLGSVQSRYIFEGAGGDQFVGRAATGLSTSDPDFAILPPHQLQYCMIATKLRKVPPSKNILLLQLRRL